ncbi:MAG TPA: RsmB/NOP family class I SAM-dependent RNA methyltransferase, partial [Sphingomonas sp.]|nr:RsmB/NOP family class I SAM-dependent RNA methyltransferase [Sphingomonas sp.]
GTLIHIVCSLLDEEGAGQVSNFLSSHAGWVARPIILPAGESHGPGRRLIPAKDGTDGFFVAALVRSC